jgi:hypothetical protein
VYPRRHSRSWIPKGLQEGKMLWIIAVAFIILWLLGLVTGLTTGLYIHLLCGIAIVLLVVSINQEVMVYLQLSRKCRYRKIA